VEGNQVPGSLILADVRAAYERYRAVVAPRRQRAVVVRFAAGPGDPPRWRARMEASRISAGQKIRNLAWLGLDAREVVLPGGAAEHEFASLIARASSDPAMTAIIVQLPVPERLRDLVHDIAPGKDIDALLGERSPYPACATSDGVARLVVAYAPARSPVAVVGARGFVGAGVTRLLQAQGRELVALDMGDDLNRVHDADVVVAATGSPGVLGPEHLRPHHRLVVDTGFVPQPDGTVAGDVRRDAYPIPQRITPVPGGIGPVEMAVLLERVVAKEADPGLVPWQISPQTMRPQIPGLREPAPQAGQGDLGREPRHTDPSGEPSHRQAAPLVPRPGRPQASPPEAEPPEAEPEP